MTLLSTTWQQTTGALEHEDFDAAYWVLEHAAQTATRPERARLLLYTASLHSLYGEAASPELGAALEGARALDASVAQEPLALALSAELDARLHAEAASVPSLPAGADALARYHAMCALALAGQPQAALDAAPPARELPTHLRWRLRSWQADCEEALGHLEAAAHLYAEAAHLTGGLNRAIMLQEQAAVLIAADDHAAASQVLARARAEYTQYEGADLAAPDAGTPDLGLNLANWHYLNAQAELGLDRPEAALTDILEAARLESLHGDPSYGVALVHGQVLTQLGRQDEAVAQFEAALALAAPKDRPYALHELGVAYLDLDRPVEAREQLQEALAHDDYPFAPEVQADYAESEYRLGRLQEAERSAQLALSQGATVPASLVLGSVALDYYHLDDALEHYERVTREAAPGTRDWITAHQMAADVMAQQGFPDPAAAYAHAQAALEHTDPDDEWQNTLRDHLEHAQEKLQAGRNRTLN